MELTRELPHESWAEYLQDVTLELRDRPVTVEVTRPEHRPAVEAQRMALQTLMYDRRDDVFEVSAARGGPRAPTVLRHLVDHPIRIEVNGPPAITPNVISVIDGEGVRTVVRIGFEAVFTG